MRVVLLTEMFSKEMGYISNGLAKYLARLGVDVHVVTTSLPPYHTLSDFSETYGRFLGSGPPRPDVEKMDGFTVHTLRFSKIFGLVRMKGFFSKMRELRPDVVQAIAPISWIPLDAALAQPFLGYRLFTGCHQAASGFPLARRRPSRLDPEYLKCLIARALHGRLISWRTRKCYAVTKDCAEIAVRYLGVQKEKVEVMHLGVDTDFFFPARGDEEKEERARLRAEWGVAPSEILCIYTGKLTEAKNALLLAEAVARLRSKGKPFKGLFVGDGVQKGAIQSVPGCRVLPFVPFHRLGPYYRASDAGVWTGNESTSTLDAAACGLPVVISDNVVYRDHVDGNGLVHKMNDIDDLENRLLELENPGTRERLGRAGAEKMRKDFSWEGVARKRLRDYQAACGIASAQGPITGSGG